MENMEDRFQLSKMKVLMEMVAISNYGYFQVELETGADYVLVQENENMVHHGGDLVIRLMEASWEHRAIKEIRYTFLLGQLREVKLRRCNRP